VKVAVLVAIGIGIASVALFAYNLIPLTSVSHEQNSREVNSSACTGSAACFTGTITNIVDGDTIDVKETRIRLSLINTPELNEEGYNEAKQFTSSLCPVGSQILVDQDDGQLEDRFGRMLAKVTCAEDKNLNSELLSKGYAGILTEYCSVSEFSSEDWIQGYGCAASGSESQLKGSTNANCDPSYPGICIPPPPPDLDCGEIPYRSFKVLEPDPHGFDRDNDGIGCEG
jgi:micrococcal nuclease